MSLVHRFRCCLLVLAVCLAMKHYSIADMKTVVVLPFTNYSKNPSLHWLSETFPELLEERLHGTSLTVLGREERLVGFDRVGIPYGSRVSKASLIKVGQELDASVLLIGEFNSDGKEIDVSVSLLDLKKNVLAPRLSEKGSLEQLQSICGRVAWKVLGQLDPMFRLTLDSYLAAFSEIPNLALENYVRGLIEPDRAKQIRFFRQADRAHPNFSKAIFQLGKVYHRERDYATSSLWLQKLVRLDGDIPEVSFLLGLNHLYLKQYDRAATEFERLSRVLPLNEVHSNLGIALSLNGSREGATEALQKAIDADLSEGDHYFNLGFHLWKMGDFAGALKNLNEVVRNDNSDSEAHYLLSKCYKSLGRAEESRAAWETARTLNPRVENWETRGQMPQLFRIQPNFDERSFRQLQLQIRQVQESKIKSKSSQDQTTEDVAKASQLLAAGNVDAAQRLLAQAIQRTPNSADARLVMGKVLEAKGDLERAVSELRTSLWLRDSVSSRLLLSRLYLELNRRSEAHAQATTALKMEPGNREAQELLSKAVGP
jgi:tetratricopeptide (TPR) repeat protein